MPRIVYRKGSTSGKNFTPRPDKDVDPAPGKPPGLSVFETKAMIPLGPKDHVQILDLDLLPPGLAAFPDDPIIGGDAGHLCIVPVTADGRLDEQALAEWAASRDAGANHPFASDVKAAIIGEEVGP